MSDLSEDDMKAAGEYMRRMSNAVYGDTKGGFLRGSFLMFIADEVDAVKRGEEDGSLTVWDLGQQMVDYYKKQGIDTNLEKECGPGIYDKSMKKLTLYLLVNTKNLNIRRFLR